jgi:hypothetical protein
MGSEREIAVEDEFEVKKEKEEIGEVASVSRLFTCIYVPF